jgi:hypothetical protein
MQNVLEVKNITLPHSILGRLFAITSFRLFPNHIPYYPRFGSLFPENEFADQR